MVLAIRMQGFKLVKVMLLNLCKTKVDIIILASTFN